MHEVDNYEDCYSLLEERQLHWVCSTGNDGVCVDTQLRGIEATCIVSGDGTTLCKLVPLRTKK